MAVQEKLKSVVAPIDPRIQEMMEAGLHFGHKTSKTHPKMLQYIEGVRNTIHLFDLAQTRTKLDEVLEEFVKLLEEGKIILLVGTKVQVKAIVKDTAEKLGFPYVSEHWIGGMFTNFETIKKRIERLLELEEQKAGEKYGELTKKERARLDREIATLTKKFGGIKKLEKVPDAVFIFDLDENELAAREAKQRGIRVFALVDTNTNPEFVDNIIPANNDAISAIQYIAKEITDKVKKVKPKATAKKEKTEE